MTELPAIVRADRDRGTARRRPAQGFERRFSQDRRSPLLTELLFASGVRVKRRPRYPGCTPGVKPCCRAIRSSVSLSAARSCADSAAEMSYSCAEAISAICRSLSPVAG
jgi:hypothetical protein